MPGALDPVVCGSEDKGPSVGFVCEGCLVSESLSLFQSQPPCLPSGDGDDAAADGDSRVECGYTDLI